MILLNPGAIRIIGARFLFPMRGIWEADLEVDPDVAALVPTSGKVALTIGAAPGPVANLVATVDPRGSGTFAGLAKLRLVGGGGGWDKTIPAQDFTLPTGVLSTLVYPASAAAAGEVVTVLLPKSLGTHFHVTRGPASRVLLREPSWWVDPTTGTTFVGPRPPSVPDPSLTLIEWDPQRQVAKLTCDTLVFPGTPLVDPRLPGPLTIVDVEQTFDANGSSVLAWCASATSTSASSTQLAKDLQSMVEELGGLKFVRTHLYRIVAQNPDGTLQLQAVQPGQGVPDTLPIDPWTGVSGISCKYLPSTLVRVAYVAGDAGQPLADAYQPGQTPLEIDAVASALINLTATLVNVGGPGATPLTRAAWSTGLLAGISAWIGSYSAHPSIPLTGADILALGSALTAAIGAIPLSTTKAMGV